MAIALQAQNNIPPAPHLRVYPWLVLLIQRTHAVVAVVANLADRPNISLLKRTTGPIAGRHGLPLTVAIFQVGWHCISVSSSEQIHVQRAHSHSPALGIAKRRAAKASRQTGRQADGRTDGLANRCTDELTD
jgi:hypothetical protein